MRQLEGRGVRSKTKYKKKKELCEPCAAAEPPP
jgi:hypothetical protein